ncbi:hypothetical protein MACK_001625 [Theileria orientalis]|uniref:Uncharacterized protein n=1 Tax=Theileria orientalis TaxID=68886 RepID=A0A976MCT9_THEOR|nr:hypothetical protein MACK_001625 [Theileria orientalis]
MGMLVIFLLVSTVLVSSNPPETSKNKSESKNRVKTTIYIPTKKLKLSSSIESDTSSIFEQINTISDKISTPNTDVSSEEGEVVIEVFKKFDFLTNIFYNEDEKLYKARQGEFIEQIRMMILELIEDISPECKSALLYYLGRTCSNTVEQYRNEMAQAITFVKLKMFDQLKTLCTVLGEVLENVKIFPIINKQWENVSVWGTNGSSTPKNPDEIESEDSIEMAFNKIKLGMEGPSGSKEVMTDETGSLSYILPDSPGSDCYVVDRKIESESSDLEVDCYSGSSTPEEDMDEIIKRQKLEDYGITIESEGATVSKMKDWETGSVDSYMDSNSIALVKSIRSGGSEWEASKLRPRRNVNVTKTGLEGSTSRVTRKGTSEMESTRKDSNMKQQAKDTSGIRLGRKTYSKTQLPETSRNRVTLWHKSGIGRSNRCVSSEERQIGTVKEIYEHTQDDTENTEENEGLAVKNDEMGNDKSKNERELSKKNYSAEIDKWNNEEGINDMKTFISHIREGYMPKFRESESKLAEAFTASVIIMQETGMIDNLMTEYRMRQPKSKFVREMLFEVMGEREEYVEDLEAADYLGLHNIYEFNKFTKWRRRGRDKLERGGMNIKQAAIQLGINTFPNVEIDFEKMDDFGVLGEEKYIPENDLEDVLLKREITVLIYPKEYEAFLNFHSRKMNSFYNRYIMLAVKIMEKHYFRQSLERIKIRYRRAAEPMADLMQGKGHMTGMYFVMDNKFPSVALFGSRTETTKVPLLSYRSFIMVHNKYGVNDLKGWQDFIRKPQEEKRIIITNFTSDTLFAQAETYKVVQIVLTNQSDSPLQKMLEFNPTSGVFWGIDNTQYSYGDFNIIEFPYQAVQGPYFRKDQ